MKEEGPERRKDQVGGRRKDGPRSREDQGKGRVREEDGPERRKDRPRRREDQGGGSVNSWMKRGQLTSCSPKQALKDKDSKSRLADFILHSHWAEVMSESLQTSCLL